MKKIIIDTDTASDDAVALVMALREPTLQVFAITTVAGNVPLDAEAADIVCRSGIPLTIATIEACHGAGEFGPQQMAELEAASERGWFCVTCNDTMRQNSIRSRGYPQIGLPDPIALAALTRPDLITGSFDAYVRVETRGRT